MVKWCIRLAQPKTLFLLQKSEPLFRADFDLAIGPFAINSFAIDSFAID
jgi:hypothetical protein